MYFFFTVLIVIVSILIVLIVLVQNSKGGGLSSTFASSNQFMGVRKTADFLEKATWTLASSLLVLCLVATISLSQGGEKEKKSTIEEQVRNSLDPNAIPDFQNVKPTESKSNTPAPATPNAKPNNVPASDRKK
jgi:preprotein translocase subunit SecG